MSQEEKAAAVEQTAAPVQGKRTHVRTFCRLVCRMFNLFNHVFGPRQHLRRSADDDA